MEAHIQSIADAMRERWLARDEPSRLRAAYEEIYRAQQAATDAFADTNGWKKAPSTYDLSVLGRGTGIGWGGSPDRFLLDHPIAFSAKRRYVAIVGQPYPRAVDLAQQRARRKARGLVLHVPPDPFASIHYPGGTLFLVITQPGVEVNWLPDQDGRLADRWAARREAA